MKISQTLGYYRIIIREKHIKDDEFYIESTAELENGCSSTFYIHTKGGFSTADFQHFDDIEKAMKFLKKEVIKPYFESRGMDNPKGF